MASFRDLLGYYRHYKYVALLSIGASSIFEIIDLGTFYAIGQILNVLSNETVDAPINALGKQISYLLPNGDLKLGNLVVLSSIIFLISVVRAPIQPWVGPWFHWKIALDTRKDYSEKAIAKILTLPLGFYEENNPGRIAGRVAKGLANHTWTYPEVAGQLIPKLVRVLAIFLIIVFVEWPIAIAFLLSFCLIFYFNVTHLHHLIKEEEILDKHQENTESRTAEIIANIKTVKAFATESQELKRQKQRLTREYKMVIYNIHLGYIKLGMQERTMVQICIFLIFLFTLIPTVQGRISIGYFVTIFTISMMAYSELDPITQLSEVFARRYASMIRFHEFINLPSGSDAGNLVATLENTGERFTGKLEFRNVSFGYDQKRRVLQDVNLFIEPYQTVALVGRSGSGKSTLVKLLFRYFEPLQGSILIDGKDIRSLDITNYRRRLAIVHQEVDVFNGSLLDNLTYGNPNITLAEVKQACAIARVEEFIEDLPHGYQTIVGERGMRLSGGQRQRLGIARALIVNPDVLIFDEATSSLDYESERAIQLAMRSILGTRTTLIIAHRLSTIREADKIVVLDGGKIIEAGTHEELLAIEGLYHSLHSYQLSTGKQL
ncbi:ABC transporter ATP-binding protein [Gloeocapsa sp. PCC 73106]|uniref:ABC transporter ATP-binding protein n=1 Tax=Gloeocapsa sp. PCC 73106 TaxID=102232 RepID=UPI0002AD0BC5|nr:ABC transporter ATP-binding protein [Gloeocapsa sp. PCC 73106]ELR98038.1 ABC-type multidrug transport system, ATPase and permease component [Gloeocapsa sp. PCC 73106]